ncbi:MAG: HAD-IA family hydrolase [Clostridia bacterium]|nr:HAD-IA family hydrolase [Clostridia bacterium]
MISHRHYIFDFDGTLVNSMPFWAQKMLNILQKTSTAYPKDIIKIITPLGDAGTAEYFKSVLKVPLSKEEMFAQMDEYALPLYRDKILFKDGVYAYLLSAKTAGVHLHVLTASPHKMVDPCLKRLGVFEWFDNVWTCEDFGLSKSSVEIYQRALEKLRATAKETAFFDDNLIAVQTAGKAGLYTVGVHDDSSEPFTAEIKANSNTYFTTFEKQNLI